MNNPFYRVIYSFEFPDKSVYVGLTYNPNERKNEHLNPKRNKISTVYKYIISSGLKPKFKILSDHYEKKLASKKEGEFLEKYMKNGWNILNRVKTGGLGGNRKFWSKNKCIEVARKCKYKSEFIKKHNGAYESALKNGWIDICCNHMKKASAWNKMYDLKMCVNAALRCKSKAEFQRKYNSQYQAARKNTWLIQCCHHMKRPNIIWTLESCSLEAKKYKKRSEFKRNAAGAYDRAKNMGWLEKCCQHMGIYKK